MTYDPAYVSRYYDEYGEREWDRLEASPAGRVSFHLHRRYLQRYVEAGDHVLEVGAGPGRFTIELALLSWEEDFCRETGALDGGTHIIVVVRKTATANGQEGRAPQRAHDVGASL